MFARSHQSVLRRGDSEFVRWQDRTADGSGLRPEGDIGELLTPPDELHVSLSDLYANQTRWMFASVRDRIELIDRCIKSVASVAHNWVDVACEIKQIPTNSPCRAEEVLSGPVIAMRYLRLMLRNLKALDTEAGNPLPGRLTRSADGRWHVPVLPMTRDLFDPICFVNF